MSRGTDGPTNAERADWAEKAVHAFAVETRQIKDGELDDDRDSVITDLLCDLLHYARLWGYDPTLLLDHAEANFHLEEAEEELDEADDGD